MIEGRLDATPRTDLQRPVWYERVAVLAPLWGDGSGTRTGDTNDARDVDGPVGATRPLSSSMWRELRPFFLLSH